MEKIKKDFNWALNQIKEGKKVRRAIWGKDTYLTHEYGEIYASFNNEVIDYKFYLQDFEATDWEIYEEEDNWNLFDNESYEGFYSRNDIEILKEKIFEDIAKNHFNKLINIDKLKQIINRRFGIEDGSKR